DHVHRDPGVRRAVMVGAAALQPVGEAPPDRAPRPAPHRGCRRSIPARGSGPRGMSSLRPARLARVIAVAIGSLAIATVLVAYLQDVLHVPNPSAVYLIAVVATALVGGAPAAVVTSVAAFLLYDYLFIEPRYTLTVNRPEE